MEIIPAIDLRAGRCVRLWQGDFREETVFSADPLAVALSFVEQGAERLHLVDLDGAKLGQPCHLAELERIALAVPIPVQFGGGLRSEQSVEQALAAGAERVILGTAAIRQPVWLSRLAALYPKRIIVSVDTKDGSLASAGWLEQEQQALPDFLQRLKDLGFDQIIHTAIERDGTLSGPDWSELQLVLASGLGVIAAGGVSSLPDLSALQALAASGLQGVIVGRALYEQRFTLAEAKRLLTGGRSDVG